uniref:hypothetical protein n=1 Tax=uncultured Allobacillus sp. TaxID=1638025 RepID=UPI002596C0C3|nr:hypothetical protein [uncultured Allobacillus sp.]
MKITIKIIGCAYGFVRFEVIRPFDRYTKELTFRAFNDFLDAVKFYCSHKGYVLEIEEAV